MGLPQPDQPPRPTAAPHAAGEGRAEEGGEGRQCERDIGRVRERGREGGRQGREGESQGRERDMGDFIRMRGAMDPRRVLSESNEIFVSEPIYRGGCL